MIRPIFRRKLLSLLILIFGWNKRLRDFVFWPLSNKLLPKNYSEVINFGEGLKITVYQDVLDMVSKTIMLLGEGKKYPWEPQTSELFIDSIKGKRSILIAGGHLGYYALIAAKTNPRSTIYVFEPTRKLFDRLVLNVKNNNLRNVIVENKALTKANGQIDIVVDGGQSSLVKHKGNEKKGIESVEGVSIDSYFGGIGVIPDFMLLDIEGYETFVLEGASTVLSNKPGLIIEINERMLRRAGTSKSDIYKMLESKGYVIKRVEALTNNKEEMDEECYNIFCKTI